MKYSRSSIEELSMKPLLEHVLAQREILTA